MDLRQAPLYFPDRPFTHFLQDAADHNGERIALDCAGQVLTYRELEGTANALAHALAALGFGPGQRAAVISSNRPEAVVAIQAIMVAGGAAVTPNPAWKRDELRDALELTAPTVVIAEDSVTGTVDDAFGAAIRICLDDPAPPGWRSFGDLVHTQPGTRPPFPDQPLDATECALIFSSGTTGMPKAVRHSHRSLTAAAYNWASAGGFGEGDRFQFFLPLGTIYGLLTVFPALRAGARITLFPRFDLQTMLEHIQAERVTIGFGASPIAVAMDNHPDLESFDLSSIRYFIWGATPIAPDVANRVTARTGMPWLHAYGTSEAAVGFVNPVRSREQWRLDSPGIPTSGAQVRVVDPETGATLEAGQQGELVFGGPQRMLGYLPDEANEGAFLPDGSWRSGDIGWLEPEGWAHITDRAKEMIKASGFSVAPVEIENVLFQHPAVADCGVYGVAHARLGEAPVAAVVVRTGATVTEEEIKEWVASRLARYKHLSRVRFVAEIPRNPSGKVLRRVLKAEDPDPTG